MTDQGDSGPQTTFPSNARAAAIVWPSDEHPSSLMTLEDSKISVVTDVNELQAALTAMDGILVGVDCETTGLDSE